MEGDGKVTEPAKIEEFLCGKLLKILLPGGPKVMPVHIFACIFLVPRLNLGIYVAFKQQIITNTVLRDIYSYSLDGATTVSYTHLTLPTIYSV